MPCMYIRVTTRCNMSCIHCMYSCTTEGTDMSFSTFKKAVDIAYDSGDFITIGGGEPTLNPRLIGMLGYAVLVSDDIKPYIVINGTCSKRVWNILFRAYRKKNIYLYVSKDPWHDFSMVKDYVIKDADKFDLWYGNKGTKTIILKGRALENKDTIERDVLDNYNRVEYINVDPSVVINPDGSIYAETDRLKYIGGLSEENVDRAREIVYEYEDQQ